MGWLGNIARLPPRFIRLPNEEKRLLLEAAAWLCVAQATIRLLPFRWLAPLLGAQEGSPSIAVAGFEAADRTDIRHCTSTAIEVASRHLPCRPTCLARAITAKAMLGLRGMPSTLYLGVAKHGEAGLRAHAWLAAQGYVLTGGAEADGFDVISSFS